MCYGVYIHDDIHLFPYYSKKNKILGRLIVAPIIRLDYHSEQKEFISYRLGFIYNFNEKQTYVAKFSLKNAYKIPNFNDLFLPSTSFAEGNADLKAEKSIGLDIGFLTQPIDSLQININYFYNKIKDLIVWQPGASGKWRPSNLNSALSQGGEIESNYFLYFNKIDGHFLLNANYSLNFIIDKTNEQSASYNKFIPRKPVEMANANINYVNEKYGSIRFASRFVGFRYLTATNTKYIDSYTLFDLIMIARYQECEMQLTIFNLFDTKYIDLMEYPVPGIEWQVSLRYFL